MSIATGIAMGIARGIASSIVAGGSAAPEPGPVVLSLANNNGRFTEGPAGTWVNVNANARAQADKVLEGDGWASMDYVSASTQDAVVLSFSTAAGLYAYTALPWGIYKVGAAYFYRDNGTEATTGVAAANGDKIRLRREGTTIYAEKSTDGGTVWTAVRTFSTGSAATLYVNVESVLGNKSVVNPLGFGVSAIVALLVLFGFESNSGGIVPLDDLTAQELAVSHRVKTMNPLTLWFEWLDIGTNNNLQHQGITAQTMHGWHVGLKNQSEAGDLGPQPIYMCELGQGGSKVADWNTGGTYWTRLVNRVDAAVAQITAAHGTAPRIMLWVSHGINDALTGTSAATYKAGELDLLARIDARYGIDGYQIDLIPNAGYRATIAEIAAEVANGSAQDMVGKQTYGDIYHLGYQGLKDQVAEKVTAVNAI